MIDRRRLMAGGAAAAILPMAAAGAAAIVPPPTPRREVMDEYFGTRVADPYRWMETAGPEQRAWFEAQNEYARSVLDRIPGRKALSARVGKYLAGGESVSRVRAAGGRVFYLKQRPGGEHFTLCVQSLDGGDERVLVDPLQERVGGKPGAIDYYAASHDGAWIAYGVSPGGSEDSVLRFLNVATGRRANEAIGGAAYANPSWRPDGESLFYMRLNPNAPATNRYANARVYLHKIGTDPSADVPIAGAGVEGSFPLKADDIPFVVCPPGSPFVLGVAEYGSDFAVALFVARLDQLRQWQRVADFVDGIVDYALCGNDLYLLSRKNAPRLRVLRVRADAPDLASAEVVVPSSQRVIGRIVASRDALYVSDLDAGIARLRRYDFKARTLDEVTLPVRGTLRGPAADAAASDVFVGLQDWTTPQTWFRVDRNGLRPTGIVKSAPIDMSAFVSEETVATSWDGAKVPLSIVRRRDLPRDGKRPVWLMAYGAFGISMQPEFVEGRAALLEDGGVYAVAHVRGGGENGVEWHEAGRLANKPNSYKDLIACAERLIELGYCSPATLAIQGESGGGATVGMAANVRPDLFRVVFSIRGDCNTLRLEAAPDGGLPDEFGTVTTKAGFEALLAMDSTHHVRPGAAYPAYLITAGYNDARVPPWQPGKLAAHLQAATSSRRPVLLRVDFAGGHVATQSSKSQRVAELVDHLAFLYWQTGQPAYQR